MSGKKQDRGTGQRAAEEAFAQLFSSSREITDKDFEAYCAEHDDLEAELRGLYADWKRVKRLVGFSKQPTSTPAARTPLEVRDPDVTLESIERPSSLVMERLGEHSPSSARYEVKSEVARGGMGVILKVWDQNLRRNLAMKALIDEHGAAPDGSKPPVQDRVLARFLEEAQITSQLGHPGIVPVHDLGLDPGGRVFFTMPLIRGRAFGEVIDLVHEGKEGWTKTKALRVILKVCEAVAYAHSRDVIHRDLKPSNVMVGRFGETYVMDWGLARVMGRTDTRDIRLQPDPAATIIETDLRKAHESSPSTPLLTMDGAVVGTPSYMSPEQTRGRIGALDGRTDVYSIGAMLYHLLTQQMPYCPRGAAVMPLAVVNARLEGPPPSVLEINPAAPRELVDICEKAMATALNERYVTPLELAEDIERYLTSRPVMAHETTLAYQLMLAYRRNRLFINTAAGVCALILGFAALLFTERQRTQQRTFDVMSARALPRQTDELFPALPATIPALSTWIDQVDRLLDRESVWKRESSDANGAQGLEVEEVISLMSRLRELRPEVVQRLELARNLQDPAYNDSDTAWPAAISAIAASPLYRGFMLAPIEGLVPLGADPASGYWEFWNVLSGGKPARDPRTGAISPGPEDGIVLVLLPRGTFQMGLAGEEETREVSLAPFLAGKYEVTQAQWMRVMHDNPSGYPAGLVLPQRISPLRVDYALTGQHPVETVNWHQAAEFAQRVGLSLLTEEQWEYVCRAGSTEPWYTGTEGDSLEGHANLRDRSGQAIGQTLEWDDRHALHAPVGSFAPNAFGLFDMQGNVSEWTRSWYGGDWIGAQARKVFRGAGFANVEMNVARSGFRMYQWPSDSNFARGVRVGLDLNP